MAQINRILSSFKQEMALAKFLHGQNSYYDKAVWRLLLEQYRKENGQHPFDYDPDGNVTGKSLLEFERVMEEFAYRIVPMHRVLKDDTTLIPLRYNSAFADVYIWLRKV